TGQEQHGQEVQESPPEPGRAELGPPVAPGAVMHGDLGHLEAAPRREHRDEAVKLAVQADLLHDLSPVDLEAGVEIVEPHAGEPARHPVEESGRPGLGARILTILLPAGYEVDAILEAAEELGDLRRIVLKIGVQGHDDVALGLAKSDGEGRGLAEVSPELEPSDPRIFDGELLDQLEGAVAAPVVDEEDLIRTTEAFERLGQLAVEDTQAFHLVEDRQDHRDLDLLHLGVLPRSRCVNAYGQSSTVTVKSSLPLPAV